MSEALVSTNKPKTMYLIYFDSSVPSTHADFTVRLYVQKGFSYDGGHDVNHFTQHIEDSLDLSSLDSAVMLGELVKKMYPELNIKLLRLTTFSEHRELDLNNLEGIGCETFCAPL